jgi:uncharacterized protein (TIGR03118 family)
MPGHNLFFTKNKMYMKTIYRDRHVPGLLFIVASVLMVNTSCTKTPDAVPLSGQNISDAQVGSPYSLSTFEKVNLNANNQEYHAIHVNSDLHNAWGMSESPGGTFWISAADGGVSYVYDDKGSQKLPRVTIPSHLEGVPGNPTGNIFNGTPDFIISGTGKTAKFIFASEDGTVSGWNGGASAIVVIDNSGEGAGYTGLDIANDDGANFLYVANFEEHKVDVFDKDFQPVSGKPFTDPGIPSSYAPFNIRDINNMLYVTYAVVGEDGDDETGPGLGFVDVYWPNGSLSKRIATQGVLNAPWGIAEGSPELIGASGLLIGNFGDGHISVYDWDGHFKGQLKNSSGPVAIDGLWALDNGVAKTNKRQLYFTAGPDDEADGVFGFLLKF